MQQSDRHIISASSTVKQALVALNTLVGEALTLFVIDDTREMIGTVTDGDIRRALVGAAHLDSPITEVMKRDFKYLCQGAIDIPAIRQYREQGITLLPELDAQRRIVRIHDFTTKMSLLPIDAVVMAGGKGERLRPLTLTTPKPLLKVGEKCIIDYNLENLVRYGIDNIAVTVNYLAQQIENHLELPVKGVNVRCFRESAYYGTVGSVVCVETGLHDTVLIMNSDLFTDINLEDFYLHFKHNNADMSVAAVPYSVVVPYGILELEGRQVSDIREKPTYNYYANAGIYLVKREVLQWIPRDTYFDATDLIALLVAKKRQVIRYPLTGVWVDIGKQEDYRQVQEIVKHRSMLK